MPPTVPDLSPFDTMLGDWKTKITAAFGIIFAFLSAFGIIDLTPEQTTAGIGVALLLAAIFQRIATKKVQVAAGRAEVAAESAAAAAISGPAKRGEPMAPTSSLRERGSL